MKLELKHLAPYLPYGLNYQYTGNGITKIMGSHNIDIVNGEVFKPILRPLSDLTKEIEIDGEIFIPYDWIKENIDRHGCYIDYSDMFIEPTEYAYNVVSKLFEWHFDVFGLIEKGLAIDINDLTNQ